ncbi:Collagen triple helix repeat [Trinorchestia longiramus]|nr:Collagen triple helix repeat [Trinorchestia longiramus]
MHVSSSDAVTVQFTQAAAAQSQFSSHKQQGRSHSSVHTSSSDAITVQFMQAAAMQNSIAKESMHFLNNIYIRSCYYSRKPSGNPGQKKTGFFKGRTHLHCSVILLYSVPVATPLDSRCTKSLCKFDYTAMATRTLLYLLICALSYSIGFQGAALPSILVDNKLQPQIYGVLHPWAHYVLQPYVINKSHSLPSEKWKSVEKKDASSNFTNQASKVGEELFSNSVAEIDSSGEKQSFRLRNGSVPDKHFGDPISRKIIRNTYNEITHIFRFINTISNCKLTNLQNLEELVTEGLRSYFTEEETPQQTMNLFPAELSEEKFSVHNQTEKSTVGPGPPGLPGDKGAVGDRGMKGVKGMKGDKGTVGEKGLRGDTGDKGGKGIAGDKGFKGVKGETGKGGDSGPKGEKGDSGQAGDRGPKGIKGDSGPAGIRGLKGIKGSPGVVGMPGPNSEKGEPGQDGQPGMKGVQGNKGEKGDQGVKGLKGSPGDPGNSGVSAPERFNRPNIAKRLVPTNVPKVKENKGPRCRNCFLTGVKRSRKKRELADVYDVPLLLAFLFENETYPHSPKKIYKSDRKGTMQSNSFSNNRSNKYISRLQENRNQMNDSHGNFNDDLFTNNNFNIDTIASDPKSNQNHKPLHSRRIAGKHTIDYSERKNKPDPPFQNSLNNSELFTGLQDTPHLLSLLYERKKQEESMSLKVATRKCSAFNSINDMWVEYQDLAGCVKCSLFEFFMSSNEDLESYIMAGFAHVLGVQDSYEIQAAVREARINNRQIQCKRHKRTCSIVANEGDFQSTGSSKKRR